MVDQFAFNHERDFSLTIFHSIYFWFFSAVVFTYLGQLLSVGNVRFAHIPSTQQLSSDVNTTASKKQNKSCLHWQANPFLGKR
jgi:hypothetical protein